MIVPASVKKLLVCLIIFVSTIMASALIASSPSSAQFLPGVGQQEKAPAGLDALLEEARKDGSTVIVVSPNQQKKSSDDTMDNMRAERFLQVRENLKNIFGSVSSLWSNMKGTVQAASPDGTFFWLLRAIGTALLGLVIGYYATRPIITWTSNSGFFAAEGNPQTAADKIQYLLQRALFGAVYVIIYFAVAMIVAVVLDSAHEPSRRVIFEIVAWYCVYRFLRHGVSWNLFAGGMPHYRLVNLSDDEAVRLHKHWHVGVAIIATVAAVARFFTFTGELQIDLGIDNVLTAENVKFIQICVAAFATLVLIAYIVKDWKSWQHIFAPADPEAPYYTLRSRLAALVPVISLIYAVVALASFVFRLALGMPAPGVVIAAPFAIFYVAIVVYGVILIIIQALYNRRIHRFEALAAAERARHESELEKIDYEAGEEMEVGPSSASASIFEYQPMFRSFFENAALAIVATIALGELGRTWGIPVGQEGNAWAGALDIILAAVLCWIAYSAVRIYIDRKLEEEGGVPEEEELGGDGGGAGATRMATLLPIMRYVLVTIIFSIAIMVILSRMGIDIAPIFAGAGVVGIAVGFGAQTLIRDIFSGAFFLMDDAFRKGEYVEIEGIKGTVEKISIRSFQLRHHLGALHTIPFGEIKQLTNYSRDWVLMKLPLRVTYDTDTEKVRKLVKKLGQQLLDHPQVGHTFMQPLKSQGVYKMEDSAMIIRVKFMTKPGEQFVTRKVVYESIQDLFAREGINFAHKEVTVRLADKQVEELDEDEKKAVTSAARSVIDAEAEAAAAGGKASDGGR